MASPCTTDTDYIELDVSGTPGELSATLRNPAGTFSATQGDHTPHTVTDHNVLHSQSQSGSFDNTAGTAPMVGIVVVAFDPIWVSAIGDIIAVWHSTLTIDGDLVDEGNESLQGNAMPGGTDAWFPIKTLVGEISIAAGDSVTWEFLKSIENTASSVEWEFLMGGDKLVASESF